ncbi:MAG: LemA family protein [Nitrosomonas sp.]|nr:MAG: LemA family protein [Nitrosomonas sp.]
MDIATYFAAAAATFILIYGVLLYNNLIDLKHAVVQAWSNIDILLKQRHDELPKLVEACKQYMRYEQGTLEQVILARSHIAKARETGDIGALNAGEKLLQAGLGHLFAVVEAYPELKSSEKFHFLQTRITGLENSIADRREFYNESVRINNVRIEQFPDVFIAKWFKFKPYQSLEFTGAEKQDVQLDQLFK